RKRFMMISFMSIQNFGISYRRSRARRDPVRFEVVNIRRTSHLVLFLEKISSEFTGAADLNDYAVVLCGYKMRKTGRNNNEQLLVLDLGKARSAKLTVERRDILRRDRLPALLHGARIFKDARHCRHHLRGRSNIDALYHIKKRSHAATRTRQCAWATRSGSAASR